MSGPIGNDPRSRPPAASPLRFRTVIGPLLAYHLLIAVGGFLVIDATLTGTRELLLPGSVLLFLGLFAVIAVLVWTARIAARTPRVPTDPPARHDWVCPRCALRGTDRRAVCPRCGAIVARTFRVDTPAGSLP